MRRITIENGVIKKVIGEEDAYNQLENLNLDYGNRPISNPRRNHNREIERRTEEKYPVKNVRIHSNKLLKKAAKIAFVGFTGVLLVQVVHDKKVIQDSYSTVYGYETVKSGTSASDYFGADFYEWNGKTYIPIDENERAQAAYVIGVNPMNYIQSGWVARTEHQVEPAVMNELHLENALSEDTITPGCWAVEEATLERVEEMVKENSQGKSL